MSGLPFDIPDRALFKAAEVCDLAGLQPYVLRSWEAEFPDLGVAKAPGAPRMYRRPDVEQVLRIKHLLFVEGLTLAGVRRRIDEEKRPIATDTPIEELLGRNARERLSTVRAGLRSLLELLSDRQSGAHIGPAPPAAKPSGGVPPHAPRGRTTKPRAARRRPSA
jgi:DNA-binding transcriptional MerR regulator